MRSRLQHPDQAEPQARAVDVAQGALAHFELVVLAVAKRLDSGAWSFHALTRGEGPEMARGLVAKQLRICADRVERGEFDNEVAS